jgi:excisionase family DNA binding protein
LSDVHALPAYLTPAQAAELVAVSEKTILRWSIVDPSLPVLRRGRVVRIHRDRFLAWLERQEPRGSRRINAKLSTISSPAA